MTFATLAATKDMIYTAHDDAITIDGSDDIVTPTDLAGVAVTEMYLDLAKGLLKENLATSKQLDLRESADLTKIDELVDQNQEYFQYTLAALQHKIFYDRHNEGYDTKSGVRYEDAKKEYAVRVNGFKGLATNRGSYSISYATLVNG